MLRQRWKTHTANDRVVVHAPARRFARARRCRTAGKRSSLARHKRRRRRTLRTASEAIRAIESDRPRQCVCRSCVGAEAPRSRREGRTAGSRRRTPHAPRVDPPGPVACVESQAAQLSAVKKMVKPPASQWSPRWGTPAGGLKAKSANNSTTGAIPWPRAASDRPCERSAP